MGKGRKKAKRQRDVVSSVSENSGGSKASKRKRSDANEIDGMIPIVEKEQVDCESILEVTPLPPNCLEMPCNDTDLDLARRVFLKMAKKRHKKEMRKSKSSQVSKHDVKPLHPSAVQLKAWPTLLSRKTKCNRNATVIAPTGSGKTLTFGIPMVRDAMDHLHNTTTTKPLNEVPVLGLVLVPTRELALQVCREIEKVAKVAAASSTTPDVRINVVPIYGGVDKMEQMKRLCPTNTSEGKSAIIVVATTGRLLDLINSEKEDIISHVRFLVIDEADRMAISGELSVQVDEIIANIPKTANMVKCLFSATLPDRVLPQFDEWIGKPRKLICVDVVAVGKQERKGDLEGSNAVATEKSMPENDSSRGEKGDNSSNTDITVDSPAAKDKKQSLPLDLSTIPPHITQIVHVCSTHKKPKKLFGKLSKIRKEEVQVGGKRTSKGLCIVFFNKIKTLKYISGLLHKEGHKSLELHSNIDQTSRERAMFDFKCGKVPTLLCTDIAARGIDVSNIRNVIQYDFPGGLEQYVHRAGRAGRDQKPSTVYSYFTREMKAMAPDLMELLVSSGSYIDPNLKALVVGDSGGASRSTKRRKKSTNKSEIAQADVGRSGNFAGSSATIASKDDDNELDWDDGQFSNLVANRIVLKRAAHVSDTSDEDND